ncbi:DUF2321 domain-containing protein [Aquisphaera giovannonii]|uniref:DUF2321 domain-containing protein n=1 Tax=Aquisphaera giovannonii TaxID=406548 RepID=UPI00143CE5B4|nr:DUF2321 domain-containing protein [Aquisphaera giovannonii]
MDWGDERYPNPTRQGYDVAQVCMNGHMMNSASRGMPDGNKSFCDRCGEKTITSCPSCNNCISGLDWDGPSPEPEPALHCEHCGKSYPWTERKKAAALELFAELLDLDNKQKEQLSQDLDAVASDVPRTKVAAVRIDTLLAKVKDQGADMLKGVLVEVMSESAKKMMWPNQ